MAGHAASDGENALCGLHALDILRGGLKSYENNLFASVVPSLCVLSGENDLAAGSAGRCTEALAHGSGCLECGSVKLRVEQGVEVSRVYHGNGFALGDHALIDEVACDLECCLSGALAVAGLEHVELAVFDGELHVLHITVMVFKNLANGCKLFKCLGELLCHLCDGHRGAHACNDVLALCVGKELAHKLLLAGCGVTGEGNTGAAVVAHVAKGHHLDIDSGAPAVGDIIIAAVNICTGIIPASENSLDSADELLFGIGREFLADLLLVLCLELVCQLLEIVSGELNILSYAAGFLHTIDKLLKVLLADFHDDIGVHLDEAAVAVPCPTGVIGLGCHDIYDLLIEAEVKDGVHHAGHRSARAGADGYEQGGFKVAELLSGDLLQLFDIGHDLGHDIVVYLTSVLVILGAGLGGDGEALRYGKADVCHFCQICALAAKQLTHLRIAL